MNFDHSELLLASFH